VHIGAAVKRPVSNTKASQHNLTRTIEDVFDLRISVASKRFFFSGHAGADFLSTTHSVFEFQASPPPQREEENSPGALVKVRS
jgi:hypothetical protein